MTDRANNADSKFIWMDGELVPYAEATISVLSHSLHYGGAAFEGIRAYRTTQGKTAIFRSDEHMQRFIDSIKALGYQCEFSPQDFTQAALKTIRANELQECYIRPIAYIDDSVRGLKLPPSVKPRITIAVWKWGKYMGDEGHSKGVRIAVSTFRRPDIATNMTWAKVSGNYLTSVLARREATLNGYDEALLLDPNGFVAEGSGENIFVVKGNQILTPPTGYILPGITRNSVIEIARSLGLTIQESPITRNQIYLADELFFTGTAVEVTPIREVDHHTIGTGKPGPITQKLMDLFFKVVKGELEPFRHWLTYV